MKRISDAQYAKYAEALRSDPTQLVRPELTDKQVVDRHIINLVRNDYKLKRQLHNQRQVAQEEDLDV